MSSRVGSQVRGFRFWGSSKAAQCCRSAGSVCFNGLGIRFVLGVGLRDVVATLRIADRRGLPWLPGPPK